MVTILWPLLDACREEAKAGFPLPLPGPDRLEGATFS